MPVKSVGFIAMFVHVYKAVAVDRFLGLKFSLWFVPPPAGQRVRMFCMRVRRANLAFQSRMMGDGRPGAAIYARTLPIFTEKY